jgi:HTH-type transcriptional regulator/antitoxin HipB
MKAYQAVGNAAVGPVEWGDQAARDCISRSGNIRLVGSLFRLIFPDQEINCQTTQWFGYNVPIGKRKWEYEGFQMSMQPTVSASLYEKVESAADLGRLLRAARKEAGMTLQQAALACNVSVRNLLEIERGKETARVGRVIDLLSQFGMTLLVARRELK